MEIFYVLMALLFLYILYTNVPRNNKTKKLKAPEPSGAWPILGHLPILRGQEPGCRLLAAIADECGPIYSLRFGIHELLVVSGWEIIKDCFTTNDKSLATRASIAAGKYIGYNHAVIGLAPYGPYWRDVRKLATLKLMSTHQLEKLKPVRLSELNKFLKELHDLCAKNFNPRVSISKMLESLTFNISLRLNVGKRYSSTNYEDEGSMAWRFNKAIKQGLYLSGVFVMSDAIPWLEVVDIQGHISAMKRTAKEFECIIGSWLEEHLKSKRIGCERDFMDVMISNLGESSSFHGHSRDVVVKATTLMLTLTGSGSTSSTLIWALSLLLNHREVLNQAQNEIDSTIGKEKWVQDSDIQNLPYLQAIMKETFRMYPPGPLTGIREAMEDCLICGYHVPKGTRLVVNIWKLHRDPRVWDNPNEFEPERFLKKHANVDYRGYDFEYIPFGSGRRSCPAINMGLQVVHLTLARLIQGFDWGTADGGMVDMSEDMGIALTKAKPLDVVIKPRLGSEMYTNLEEN